MTAGWAATNTLRERCPHMYGEPCDCPSKDAALALVQTALEAAEKVCDLDYGSEAGHRARYALAAALRAVREGK